MLKDIYFRTLPCIYRYKTIASDREEKIMHKDRIKQEEISWSFKKQVLDENYKTNIMNFDGKHNAIFEQIFEILNTNYEIASSILLNNHDLINYNNTIKMFKQYFGGLNPEYPILLGSRIMDSTLSDFLGYFFNTFVDRAKDSYASP